MVYRVDCMGKEDLPMPWKETCAMDQRVQFVADWLSGDYTKSELCAWYGISRPTGDKWIRRYEAAGVAGLEERSRAPHTHPNAGSVRYFVCEPFQISQSSNRNRSPNWIAN